jgi:peptide-methionine (S)-S-oxide reductase
MTAPSFTRFPVSRRAGLIASLASALFVGTALPLVASGGEAAVKIAPPAVDTTTNASGMQTAVFAGGCFWGI